MEEACSDIHQRNIPALAQLQFKQVRIQKRVSNYNRGNMLITWKELDHQKDTSSPYADYLSCAVLHLNHSTGSHLYSNRETILQRRRRPFTLFTLPTYSRVLSSFPTALKRRSHLTTWVTIIHRHTFSRSDSGTYRAVRTEVIIKASRRFNGEPCLIKFNTVNYRK